METITVLRQSVLDLAIQTTGGIAGVFDLLELNPALSLTAEVAPGTGLRLPDRAVNAGIAGYFRSNSLIPATAITDELPEGIEFWGIEYDFIISGSNGTVN